MHRDVRDDQGGSARWRCHRVQGVPRGAFCLASALRRSRHRVAPSQEWSAARTADAADVDVTIDNLNPGSTYNFRLSVGDEKGPELVVDTQGASLVLRYSGPPRQTRRPPSQRPIARRNRSADASYPEDAAAGRSSPRGQGATTAGPFGREPRLRVGTPAPQVAKAHIWTGVFSRSRDGAVARSSRGRRARGVAAAGRPAYFWVSTCFWSSAMRASCAWSIWVSWSIWAESFPSSRCVSSCWRM